MIADVIDSQGGSEYLIKILNRLGVCTSSDTLSRFISTKLYRKDKHPCDKFFDSEVFKVVSVDNLDWVHSFARVCLDGHGSSSHVTTVQVAHPLPSLETHMSIDGATNDSLCAPTLDSDPQNNSEPITGTCVSILASHVTRKRCERGSPIASPMKLTRSPKAKIRRRERTLTQGKTQRENSSGEKEVTSATVHVTLVPRAKKSITDFLVSPRELEAMASFELATSYRRLQLIAN